MLLSVIIVNYNVKYFLEQCLYSLRKACQEIESEIIVIDNNSTDNSRSWLEEKFSEVKFTWQTTNSGFGKASNFALKQATGDYVLFLNPDTILAEDSLQLCLQEMKKDSSIGALGVRMIDGSGMFLKESKRGLPTASRSFFKMSGLGSLFPGSKMFAGYYAGHLPNNETHPVDVLAGAFLLLSRKAVTITNGFDEDFFMYGEDVDISYRIQKAGLKNIYFPGTTIIHFKGESTQKYSAEYNQHFYGAMRLFTKKHFADKKGLLFITGAAISAGKILASFKGIYAKGKERKLTPRPLTT
ncbi:MAG: glycosyltransferase family 2 protein, partial [Chitinophagaceae bacterium]